jgi:CRP/FNR family transcriptional regulator, cyclic AMP receptor protein
MPVRGGDGKQYALRVPDPLVKIAQFLEANHRSATVWLTGVPVSPAGLPPAGQTPLITQVAASFPRWNLYNLRRARSSEQEAPVGKPANNEFDPQAFLAKVGVGKTIVKLEKNQHVFEQGDVADSVFYIQKGKVKLTVLSEQGKEAVVGILEPGQFFGEGCLNGHPLRIATTTAMEECVITSITKKAMIATLHTEPKFSELFMAYLLTRNSRVEEDLIDQLFNSSEKRLARLLLLLAHFGKEGIPQPILLDISQETLAEMIGTTRSRVSYFMNKFRKLGLISYNGKIEIHNSLLNAVLHEKPEIERND